MIISDLIPDELKAIDRWLVWRKVPLPGGGLNKVPIDKGWNITRQSFDAALARATGNRGIGFVFSDDNDIGGIDLDCCRDPATGEVTADWARDILAAFGPTYAEVSPSGTGVKLFAHGCPVNGKTDADMPGQGTGGHATPAIEVFGTKGFFAVTGKALPGAGETLAAAATAKAGWDLIFSTWVKPKHRQAAEVDDGERVDWHMMDSGALEFFLEGLDVRWQFENFDWFSIMCAAHFVTGGDQAACEVFVTWSAGNPDYRSNARQVRARWRSLKRRGGFGAPTLIRQLRAEGADDKADGLKRLLDQCEAEFDEEFMRWQAEVNNMTANWEPT